MDTRRRLVTSQAGIYAKVSIRTSRLQLYGRDVAALARLRHDTVTNTDINNTILFPLLRRGFYK
jgi:hypothetical protein